VCDSKTGGFWDTVARASGKIAMGILTMTAEIERELLIERTGEGIARTHRMRGAGALPSASKVPQA